MKYTKEEAVELIEKCYNEGEPIFIMRAKDILAPWIIKKYAESLKDLAIGELRQHGDNAIFESDNYKLATEAEKLVSNIFEWQGLNFEKVKLPD